MASLNEGLVLALALDDDDKRVQDASSAGNHGAMKGALTLVPDDLFGACLKFSGPNTQIMVADHPSLRLTGDLTLSAWVYLDPVASDWVRVLGKGDLTQRNYGLWYHAPLKQWLFQQYGAGTALDVSGSIGEIKANTWYHLAAVRQGNNAFIYLDGAQIGASTNVIGTPFTSADPLTLGYAGHHTAHQGLLARARVYNRALAPEEIKAVREQDRLAQPAFRKSHPIDFNLYDDHNQFVLYIDDEPAGHRLHLELHNTSAKDLQLTKTSDTASATNHHFELRFRPGTLSNKTLETLKDVANKTRVLGATTDWDFFMPNTDSGEPVSLYLLYKGSDTLFKSNEKRRVTFAHISASATGGSRGTQVEMRPHQITFVNATTPITGSRVQTLHITNQRGLKNLPLHVAFIGSNRILNDAGVSTSELKLQLMNVMREHAEHINNPKISLRVADQSKNISASQLIVTFDVEDTLNRPWALCRATELNDFKISVELVKQVKEKRGQQEVWSEQREGNVFTSEPSAGALGESRQWTLTPKKSIDLNPGDYLLLTLAGLKSSLPSGMANLYIHYENIPGYWEGQFTCQVEKAPLLFQQVAGIGTSVGIGASAPQAKLHVINQNQEANHGNTLILGPTTQSNLRLGYHQDYSWIQSHGSKPLALNPVGNEVGIGIEKPKATLHVDGDYYGRGHVWFHAYEGDGKDGKAYIQARDDSGKSSIGFEFRTQNAGNIVAVLNMDKLGNVGIGTTLMSNRLQINDSFHGSAGYGLTVSQAQYGANIQIKRRAGEGGIGLVVDNNEAGDANTLLFLVRNNVKTYPNNQNLFVIRADGNIGVGNFSPANKLDIQAANRTGSHPSNRPLYITGDIGHADNGIEFRHSNGTQGIGFGYNSIYATGTNADQHLNLMPKGSGNVGIGTTGPEAKLQIIHQNQDANGNALIVGPMGQSNLRLGYHQDYSWVQSHGGKPLAINPLGNNVGVGITNPQRRLHVMGQGQTVMRLQTIGSTNPLSQTWDILIDVDDVNDQDLMFLFNDGRNTGNWASAWVEPNGGVRSNSDARLKEDIKPLQNVLPKVLALQPSTFRWKGRVTEHRDIGLIAQEVEKVFPHLVREKHGGYALNYDHFAVLAIAAIQEQQRVIEKLEKEISQFEAKPAAQKSAKAKPTTKKKAAKKKRALSSR